MFTFECGGFPAADVKVKREGMLVAYITNVKPYVVTFVGGHRFCQDALNLMFERFKEWKSD